MAQGQRERLGTVDGTAPVLIRPVMHSHKSLSYYVSFSNSII